ncbi:hypothetical protein KR51_00021620 [Rubidibacter lacunae KORDI 51-2]|uniref:Uncharacterized protein n=1 Tax=Rubidibacter lacunae KORDI 51-2 TaxID=582515 RepID=U5DK37_9CHRO|nr:hypothetical protein [Rubidibacter lacunae]ERN41272.1 hypothetical protein KR51_00021620 [Rubidibacter lacunae KORDI 51-2]
MSNKKILRIGLAVLSAIAVVSLSVVFARGDERFAAVAEGRGDREEVAPGYDLYHNVRPELEGNPVPRRLPSFVPPGGRQIVEENIIATLVAGTEPDAVHYEIEFVFAPGCGGATACHWGRVSGYVRDRAGDIVPDPERSAVYINEGEFAKRAPNPPGDVELPNGITGYFLPWVLAAYASDAAVIWDEGPYRYRVSVKGGSKEEVVEMARSAILNPTGQTPGGD